jgi:hypothetical protein
MAAAALKQKSKLETFHAAVLVTRAEEWCVEAESAEEARRLLAAGEGHRCHVGDCLHVAGRARRGLTPHRFRSDEWPISKALGWISSAAALAGAAWIIFAIVSWTMTDPKFDPLVEATTLFFGPLWWLILAAVASFIASKIFKWAGE